MPQRRGNKNGTDRPTHVFRRVSGTLHWRHFYINYAILAFPIYNITDYGIA